MILLVLVLSSVFLLMSCGFTDIFCQPFQATERGPWHQDLFLYDPQTFLLPSSSQSLHSPFLFLISVAMFALLLFIIRVSSPITFIFFSLIPYCGYDRRRCTMRTMMNFCLNCFWIFYFTFVCVIPSSHFQVTSRR